jgi:hypothetical protein
MSDDPKCDAAANMVAWIKSFIDTLVTVKDETGIIVSFFLDVLEVLWGAGIFLALITLFVETLLFLGLDTVIDAFTSTVYDDLLCIFYCNIESDGTMTADELATINAEIASIIGGNVATVLSAMFFIMGEVGLSNVGATGTETGDCSGCGCGWCFDFVDATELGTAWSTGFTGGGTYNSGTLRWEGTSIGSGSYGTVYAVDIHTTFTPSSVQDVKVRFGTSYNDGGRPTVILYLSGSQVGRIDSLDAAGSLATNQNNDFPFGGITCDEIRVFMAGGVTPVDVNEIQVSGDGSNPFGVDNCL